MISAGNPVDSETGKNTMVWWIINQVMGSSINPIEALIQF